MLNPRVAVAQLGARRHYQQPLLFHKWGILETLYTDFYAENIPMFSLFRQPSIINKLPNTVKKALDRYEPELNGAKIIYFPRFGYQFPRKLRSAKPQGLYSSILIWASQEFSKRILERGLGNANVIYGFNGASLELFKYAKQKGIRCILDQTLAERSLVHKLFLEEENLWPGWSNPPFAVNECDLELSQREQQEQDLADHIICGSQFVKDSLKDRGVQENKVSVVSLGRVKEGQLSQDISQRITRKERGDGLRVLFAGEVGLRKGIPYLLEALKQIKGKIPFTCKIAGGINIRSERVAEYSDICDFLGRVPRSSMVELYSWADVFVFPSICEGSAMVIYEALTWGLPVITTYNSGSIVRDTVDGCIIPIRDSTTLANELIKMYDNNTFLVKTDLTNHMLSIYEANKLKFYTSVINFDSK